MALSFMLIWSGSSRDTQNDQGISKPREFTDICVQKENL